MAKHFTAFHISCLILELFGLKHVSCPPSWIITDTHVTLQVGLRNILTIKSSDKNEPENRSYLLFDITHVGKSFRSTLIVYSITTILRLMIKL